MVDMMVNKMVNLMIDMIMRIGCGVSGRRKGV